ncbi:MAG: hypothetical protein JWM65_2248 [Sphingomonas bacterium]|nr:hypothetical protein [Sphingomonas bacterium]
MSGMAKGYTSLLPLPSGERVGERGRREQRCRDFSNKRHRSGSHKRSRLWPPLSPALSPQGEGEEAQTCALNGEKSVPSSYTSTPSRFLRKPTTAYVTGVRITSQLTLRMNWLSITISIAFTGQSAMP